MSVCYLIYKGSTTLWLRSCLLMLQTLFDELNAFDVIIWSYCNSIYFTLWKFLYAVVHILLYDNNSYIQKDLNMLWYFVESGSCFYFIVVTADRSAQHAYKNLEFLLDIITYLLLQLNSDTLNKTKRNYKTLIILRDQTNLQINKTQLSWTTWRPKI